MSARRASEITKQTVKQGISVTSPPPYRATMAWHFFSEAQAGTSLSVTVCDWRRGQDDWRREQREEGMFSLPAEIVKIITTTLLLPLLLEPSDAAGTIGCIPSNSIGLTAT